MTQLNDIQKVGSVMVVGAGIAGMQAAGYGPKTFGLQRDDEGRLRIDVVDGKHPMRTYGRNDSQRVREEVKAALAARGVERGRCERSGSAASTAPQHGPRAPCPPHRERGETLIHRAIQLIRR